MKSKKDRAFLVQLAAKLDYQSKQLRILSLEIEAELMKKTTQRSPEFFGQTNCGGC